MQTPTETPHAGSSYTAGFGRALLLCAGAAIGVTAAMIPGCETLKDVWPERPQVDVGPIGEPEPLKTGEPAPYDGVLIPTKLFLSVEDVILERLEDWFGGDPFHGPRPKPLPGEKKTRGGGRSAGETGDEISRSERSREELELPIEHVPFLPPVESPFEIPEDAWPPAEDFQ